MTVYHREAKNAEEIARLLRSRGRIVITAPPRSGKTTELLRYAEERYPNGRFAVACGKEEDDGRIIQLHWNVYNNISFVDIVSKRLLGQEIEGEDVNPPTILAHSSLLYRTVNQSTPIFVDEWGLLPENVQRAILKRRLFIAAVSTSTGENDAEEGQNR